MGYNICALCHRETQAGRFRTKEPVVCYDCLKAEVSRLEAELKALKEKEPGQSTETPAPSTGKCVPEWMEKPGLVCVKCERGPCEKAPSMEGKK